MPSSGITQASIEKALASVNKENPKSLLFFVEELEKLITTDQEKGRVVPCSSLQLREVFELFSFSNTYVDFGRYRDYNVPEIKLNLSQPSPGLQPSALELLRNISTVWPQSNDSNVRMFVSLLIHFSIEQINSEIELNAGSEASVSSYRLNVPSPSPSPHVAPVTPPQKIQSSSQSSIPVTLKAYTEALVSWETKDELGRKLIIRGFIDYGISYAQKSPDSLETFFAIAETKRAGAWDEQSWAQLLCYMGIIQKLRKEEKKSNTPVYGLLTNGHHYEFSRISNQSMVSRSRRFSVARDLEHIYKYLSHCLRAIIRSSPTSSPSKHQDIHEEVAKFEEVVQPKYIYQFEMVEMPPEEMIDM